MNRLQPDVAAQHDSASSSRVERTCWQSRSTAEPFGLCVFAPLHYEPNYAYPLIVWLHGEDQDENQLRYVMPRISMRNYAAVAPRGTVEVPGTECEEQSDRCNWCQSDKHNQMAVERVLDAMDQATKRLRVHPRRVFLAGTGDGGTMAFRIAMRMPERFCGALSLGGAFPTGNAPLVRLLDARRLPLFIAVDRDNPNYPESAVCSDLRLFHAAGLAVTLRQYPSGNELSDLVLSDVDRWIMETIAAQQEATVVAS